MARDRGGAPCAVSAAERAYARELAERDLRAWEGELAGLDPATREDVIERECGQADGGDGDRVGRPDAQPDEARYRLAQSTWLAQLCSQSVALDPRELLAVIEAEPGSMGVLPFDRVAQLQLTRRLAGWLAARELTIVAALCPPDPQTHDDYLAERHLVEEISVACRIGSGAAQTLTEDARAADTVFAATRDALARGDVSRAHLGVLVSETALIEDDPEPVCDPRTGQVPAARTAADKRRKVQARVLARASEQTPAQFRRSVRTAVCAVDSQGEAERRRRALQRRDVYVRGRAGQPTAELVGHDDASTVAALHEALTRAARALQLTRGGARAARTDPDARLGACRADALAAAILGTVPARGNEDGTAAAMGSDAADGGCGCGPASRRVLEGHLVMDLDTLLREADNPCLLDGQPVPAPVGRELAAAVTVWRRIVTDPVTGHLLDYGRRVYLPEPLIRFIRARDARCTAPYCERPARQVDHRTPFPVGPSDTANTGGLCQLHHALKTAGYVDIDDGDPGGAMTWHTHWGQHVRTRPQPYLPGAPPGGTGPPDADDEPPF